MTTSRTTSRTPPVLTTTDRVEASKVAVAARRARAAVKADIAAKVLKPLDVLQAARENPSGVEGGIRVTEFLTSIPAVGPTKMRRYLEDLQISPVKRLGGLGPNQAARLYGAVAARNASQDDD